MDGWGPGQGFGFRFKSGGLTGAHQYLYQPTCVSSSRDTSCWVPELVVDGLRVQLVRQENMEDRV